MAFSVATAAGNETTGNETKSSQVRLRDNFSLAHRNELTQKLRIISGWNNLRFDETGNLRLPESEPAAGSKLARELLLHATTGKDLIVVEDASRQLDVVFCRVLPGKWKSVRTDLPSAFIVQIDFDDFRHLTGDIKALAAFDVGWGVMHELDHVVNHSLDGTSLGQPGECEQNVNAMRRELLLPERTDYYFAVLPAKTNPDFKTQFVRLAFLHRTDEKTGKRYWLVWDASVVGGTNTGKEIATL
jgi:hypothetical protein